MPRRTMVYSHTFQVIGGGTEEETFLLVTFGERGASIRFSRLIASVAARQ